MTGSSLTPPASSVATPAVPPISVSSQLPAASPSWTQPCSPRYRPYTVAHSGGSAAAATPRSLSISIPSSSPSPPAMAAGPAAMPVITSRHRPTATGPPLFTASPGALRRRPSLQSRIPPRYCTRAVCLVCALQGVASACTMEELTFVLSSPYSPRVDFCVWVCANTLTC